MFASEIWFTSPADLLGLIVTAVGIWLVVKQLGEAKLASQMEGVLALGDRFDGITEHLNLIMELSQSVRWKEADNAKAYNIILESKENRDAFFKVASFYETLSILVRRNVMDELLAFDGWGDMVGKRWYWMEKAILAQRVSLENEDYWEHWQWLAGKFDKMAKEEKKRGWLS